MARYRRSTLSGREAGAAVVAAIVLAGLAHSSSHAGTGHTADAAGLPSVTVAAGGMTPASWARSLLRSADLPVTACNLGAVEAWESAEGGNWQNTAAFNPLDTTEPAPGSWTVNGDGVRAYTSWREGLAATVATLRNGRYPGVLSSLRSGSDAQAAADAVAGSPWGTGAFNASC